ncbi:MAG TPA: hypothetical protein PKY95_03200, partial [candidate division Zixibacteria bacterium]|nr:hypothetical protein [candidate division Zixibacteria bacterium]
MTARGRLGCLFLVASGVWGSVSAQEFTPVRLTAHAGTSANPRIEMDATCLYVVWEDDRSGSSQIWW